MSALGVVYPPVARGADVRKLAPDGRESAADRTERLAEKEE